MAEVGLWLQTELPAALVNEWRAADATPQAALALDEAGWTPDMGAIRTMFCGETMTLAKAVGTGLSLEQAERRLARTPGYPRVLFGS